MATVISVPTIPLATPPPGSPTGTGSCVRKAGLIARAPANATYPRMTIKIAAPINAHSAVTVPPIQLTV